MDRDPKRAKLETALQPTMLSQLDKQYCKIVLLPAERLLRDLLLECAQQLPGLEIWVTGGWVRDRLLGLPSSDLDFGLNNMTGRQMGEHLGNLLAKPEIETKYRRKAVELGIPDFKFSSFHIIKRNENLPNKLETAGGRLFGLDIDLVNLRKEVYNGQTRNPQMEFGTAREDAFRRDATVNSLFFHLERQEVVDYTGRGLDDLDARIMRTPLDPRQTFMDDPLRVLRLIRIGSKLGFGIDPKALDCMRDPAIQRALDKMITRDRVNIEVFKMMNGANTKVAFQLMHKTNLYTPVFLRLNTLLVQELSDEYTALGSPILSDWPITWSIAYQMLPHLMSNLGNLGTLISSEQTPSYLWIIAAYAPIAGLRKAKLKAVVEEVTNAIRATTKTSQLLQSALTNFDSISAVAKMVANRQVNEPYQRSRVGMAIRSWGINWSTQMLCVILAEAMYFPGVSFASVPDVDDFHDAESFKGPLLELYSAFADFVCEQKLENAHVERPLLDGNDIQKLFGLRRGGKYLKDVLEKLLIWQFDHPDKDADEARRWLFSQRTALNIPPA